MNAKGYVVVGWLYNTNGMGTWCAEAAHSLSLCGYMPVVVVRPGVAYTPQHPCKVLTYQIVAPVGLPQRILRKLAAWWPLGRPVAQTLHFVPHILALLAAEGITPLCFMLNQSSLLSTATAAPQWVVGWAWPPHANGYFQKIFRPSSQGLATRLREALFWYRMDNYAYRHATGVLSVSGALHRYLTARGIQSRLVWPGLAAPAVAAQPTVPASDAPPVLLIAALGLEDKRKNIAWLLDCVAQIPAHLPYRLVLAGAASPAFEQSVRARLPQASFTGLLSRTQLLQHMRQADIFLMGSVVEDWGYVQVEAMAMGMVVVAPAQVPCSEIVGDDSCLFIPGSNVDCVQKLNALLAAGPALQEYKARFRKRYEQCFSAFVFGFCLIEAVES